MNPDLDLGISRLIKAPRAAVWKAWTDPELFQQWWLPAPLRCEIKEMDVRPGGGLTTLMSEDGGPFVPHVAGCYLAIDPLERIVFTNTMTSGWRPAVGGFMTTIITLKDHAEGTDYRALVMHKDPADRATHEKMGFYDGWGTVTDQLSRLVE